MIRNSARHGAQALRELTVLIADNYAFRGDYIAHVLREAGATIEGPYNDLTVERALDQSRSVAATLAYVGCTIAAAAPHALITALFARGVGCIAVCTNAISTSVHPNILVLSAPIAGFQVVDALVELVARCDTHDDAIPPTPGMRHDSNT